MKQKTEKISIFRKISVTAVILTVCFFNLYSQNNDSIIEVLLKLPNDTLKINKINNFIWEIKLSDNKKAIQLAIKNLQFAEAINYDLGKAIATKNIAAVHYYQGDYPEALDFYKKSLVFYQKINDKKGIAINYRNMGIIADNQGDLKQALDYYFKSLKLREEIDDKPGIAVVLSSIGLVYKQFGKKERKSTLEYLNKSFKINKLLDNKLGMANCLIYLGSVYNDEFAENLNEISNRDKALEYFNKGKKISIEIENDRLSAFADDAIGCIYIEIDNMLDSAYTSFLSSYAIRVSSGNKFGIATAGINLGRYYTKIKKYTIAEGYLIKSLELSKELNTPEIEKQASINLAILYDQLENYQKAYKFLNRYTALKDSIANSENAKQITRLEMQYEFDKKQKMQEIEQEKKEALQKIELKRQKTITGFFIFGFILMIVLATVILYSLREKKKANILLESKNNEIILKNTLLNQQKEEIEAQRDEIEEQRDFVIKQRDKISDQNRHITDSIIYAERIQRAVLTPTEILDSLLSEYFILYKPRDIVSGDFYWATKKDNKIIIAAADCTGHGVPGAFMSLLGISFLNEIVNKISISKGQEVKANLILNSLRKAVKTSLRQTGKFEETKDGMDIALCVIDIENMKFQYAGANNSLLFVRDGELTQYKADKMPVGIYLNEKESFTNNEFSFQKGDSFYISSDGYIDQFGGEQGRKFMSGKFKKLVLENQNLSMIEQKVLFEKTFDNWVNYPVTNGENFAQIDDVLVIGFKL